MARMRCTVLAVAQLMIGAIALNPLVASEEEKNRGSKRMHDAFTTLTMKGSSQKVRQSGVLPFRHRSPEDWHTGTSSST